MKTFRRAISLALLFIGICLVAWGLWPNPTRWMVEAVPVSAMQAPAGGPGSRQGILQARQVRVEWPQSVRIGEDNEIRLTFQPDPAQENTANAQVARGDVYASYAVMAEGRFEVSGLKVSPANPVRESLLSGHTLNLKWQVQANQAGTYQGNMWLLLRFLPLDGSQAVEVPIFVHALDIRASSFLGLSAPVARLAGGMGIIIGLAMGYDVMIDLGMWLKKKTQRSQWTLRFII